MVGCEYPGEGAIYFTIIAGPTQHSYESVVYFLHTAVTDLLIKPF